VEGLAAVVISVHHLFTKMEHELTQSRSEVVTAVLQSQEMMGEHPLTALLATYDELTLQVRLFKEAWYHGTCSLLASS
jgi:hypothetical protein